jgi:hypothetical protein
LAEAHKVINRPKTKTDRIVFAPTLSWTSG